MATHAVVRQQLPVGILAAAVVYRSCPKCSTSMSRKNFGGCSGVIVDECRCGTYFDAGELESVLAFVRSGGMQLSRRRAEDERKRRELMPPPEQREGGTSWMAAEARDPSFSLAQWIAQWIIGR